MIPTLPTRRIGDRDVSAVGLGCMPLSFERMLAHGDRALATVHAALDALLDSLAAVSLRLSPAEVAELDASPDAGDSRYPDDQPRPPLR